MTGVRKVRRPGKVVDDVRPRAPSRLYDFLDGNPVVELLPVDWVNDPRIIAQEPNFVSINATTEVDFLGQAASETIAGHYWSGSGGQADFARGRHVLPRRTGLPRPALHRGRWDASAASSPASVKDLQSRR